MDDDVALMRVMREALTSFLRCEVDTSPKPEYGFELALKKTYDLLHLRFSDADDRWSDALFPDRKGLQQRRAAADRAAVTCSLPGKGDEKRAQELLKEAGVRGLVPKPFAINRLIEKVKECVPGIEPTGERRPRRLGRGRPRFFDQLPPGFDPIVGGIAGQ